MVGLGAGRNWSGDQWILPETHRTELEPLLCPLLAVCTEALLPSHHRAECWGLDVLSQCPFKGTSRTLANESSEYMLANC